MNTNNAAAGIIKQAADLLRKGFNVDVVMRETMIGKPHPVESQVFRRLQAAMPSTRRVTQEIVCQAIFGAEAECQRQGAFCH